MDLRATAGMGQTGEGMTGDGSGPALSKNCHVAEPGTVPEDSSW